MMLYCGFYAHAVDSMRCANRKIHDLTTVPPQLTTVKPNICEKLVRFECPLFHRYLTNNQKFETLPLLDPFDLGEYLVYKIDLGPRRNQRLGRVGAAIPRGPIQGRPSILRTWSEASTAQRLT
jgi:hypothetical protein